MSSWKVHCAHVRRAAWAAVILGTLLSCRATLDGPPAGLLARFDGERSSVHAETLARAEQIARAVDEAFPVVQTLPHARRHERVDVYVREGSARAWTGVTRVDSWIEITTGDEELGPRFIVAHELAHFLLEPTWDPLPQVVEEGLCDTIACRFDPEQGARQRADIALHLAGASGGGLVTRAPPEGDPDGRPLATLIGVRVDALRLPGLVEALELDSAGLTRQEPDSVRTTLYGLGFVIVQRIGIQDLAQMCRAARVQHVAQLDPSAVLERAGLRAEHGWNLRQAYTSLVGEPEQVVLRESIERKRAEEMP